MARNFSTNGFAGAKSRNKLSTTFSQLTYSVRTTQGLTYLFSKDYEPKEYETDELLPVVLVVDFLIDLLVDSVNKWETDVSNLES
jgi:hypothetical protein